MLTLHMLGQYSNGLYQVVFGLSMRYTAIFMAWRRRISSPALKRRVAEFEPTSHLCSIPGYGRTWQSWHCQG